MKKLPAFLAVLFVCGVFGTQRVQAAPGCADESVTLSPDDEGYSASPNPRSVQPRRQTANVQQTKPAAYIPDELDPVAREVYPAAAEVLDQVGWDLRSGYNWSVGLSYYGHGKPDMPEDGSPGSRWFADFGFRNHCGNCFVYAATFYEMARLLGYPTRQIYGQVPAARGGLTPHSWVEIDINGVTYVFDPEFAHATGNNGWMFFYGTGGTWRYTDYAPMVD